MACAMHESTCAQFAVGKKQLKGMWSSSPIFANDLGALAWQ